MTSHRIVPKQTSETLDRSLPTGHSHLASSGAVISPTAFSGMNQVRV
jgi:hypothetical protein